MIRLLNQDWYVALDNAEMHDMVFVDPKDNIGLGYDNDPDNMPAADYVNWLERGLRLCTTVAPIIWFSINSRWQAEFGEIVCKMLRDLPGWEYKHNVQVFTFGNYQDGKLTNNHRPLWLINRVGAQFYPDAIKVPSWRERNGDKRAKSGGRVPGDVFDMQYPTPPFMSWLAEQPFACGISAEAWEEMLVALSEVHCGDVCDFPRVTGNNKQRFDWHPTQLHEDLIERVVKYSTIPGDRVLDAAAGTGTTGRVCDRLARDCTMVDFERKYCEGIAEAQGLTKVNDWTWEKN